MFGCNHKPTTKRFNECSLIITISVKSMVLNKNGFKLNKNGPAGNYEPLFEEAENELNVK